MAAPHIFQQQVAERNTLITVFPNKAAVPIIRMFFDLVSATFNQINNVQIYRNLL